MLGAGCLPRHTPPPQKEPTYLQTSIPYGTKAEGVYHTVNRGETLWRMAKTYGVDLQYLAELNNINDPTEIKAGQKIFIPGAFTTKHIIVDAKEPPQSPPRIVKKKNNFIWPVQGKIVSAFGIREGLRYEGIEIAAPLGTPVQAAGDGEVVYEGNLKGYGNLVILRHKNYYSTVYAHNHINLVSLGRKITRGEVIAKVGNTGPTSEPCLHFQVREKNQARNPLFFLP